MSSEGVSLDGESRGHLGGSDTERLASELAEIHEVGFDVTFPGFDPPEIDTLLFRWPATPEDLEILAPLPEHPVSVLGDLWLCGEHRIQCAMPPRPTT